MIAKTGWKEYKLYLFCCGDDNPITQTLLWKRQNEPLGANKWIAKNS